MDRRAFRSWLVLLSLLASAPSAFAEYDAYQVKAAFLLNFARLVTWPSAAAPAPGAPLVIGMHGPTEVAERIDAALAGAEIPGHPVTLRRLASPQELRGVHILYLVDDHANDEKPWLQAVRGRGTLTVGETSGFASRGGVVNFFMEDRKVRFEINPSVAKREGLELSSRLLRLARLVQEDGG